MAASLAVEAEPALVERAAHNLRPYANVRVVPADELDPDASSFSFDAVFVNAGATDVLPCWLDRLRVDGRLLVPLTVASDANASVGFGHMLLLTRSGGAYPARFVSPVGIFHCVGARSDAGNARLKTAFARGDHDRVTTLQLDAHAPGTGCWLHNEKWCLAFADG